ncbi:autotransporter assembly complex protein TamA [Marinagarivorans cellulosilyticus]|uniref:autotransporter assembly complex protein TamA n=1 Tax=Marinagarivorans cellulosilyticus TaxID=2721545 RepID=UPI001F032285|nr:BamA/TamA family outer membrane protein [Marinagarivorans cellulosilyticus]
MGRKREVALGVKIIGWMVCCYVCAVVAPVAFAAAGTPTIAGNTLLGVGVKHPFVIFVANNPALQKSVEAMLAEQRATDGKYQRASTLRTSSKYDQDVIRTYLRSQGYYAAQIESTLNEGQIGHQIYSGERFNIAQLHFDWPNEISQPPASIVKLSSGDPLVAERVLDSLSAIKRWVADEHCLRTIDVTYEAIVNYPTNTAKLTFRLKPSPQVVFGQISYEGHSSIENSYLDGYLNFKEGECFKPRLLDSTRLSLLQTNLLANADPMPGDIVEGAVPVRFRLTERKQRSISGSVGYDADVKTKFSLGWEHRNMFGRGEQLSTELTYSSISQGLEATLTVPHFYSTQQRLTLTGNIAQETTDAYDVYIGEAGANLKRDLTDKLSVNGGANLKFSRVKEFESPEDYALLSFPVSIDYSDRNDPLNPTRGWATGLQVEPFVDLYQTSRRFTRSTIAASTYYTWEKLSIKPTFAVRMATGVIDDSPLADVPADERFYVGGGGSVRGYRYQSIGETNSEGNPAGGLSFSEVSFELRSRFTNSIGVTLFMDGGYAYPTKTPKIGDEFLWGAGIGLRYHTSFAPFRFDIATPLDKREGDRDIQLYIAIGQSF